MLALGLVEPQRAGRPVEHALGGAGEVSTVTPGDLVIAPFAWSDGTCEFCREGLHTSCVRGGFWAAGGVGHCSPRC